jgi:mgtE-like transporter
MISAKEHIRESVPVLSACAVISIFSGLFMSRNEELLRLLPGILVVLPSFMGINGNISSVVTSRLSSALHMGLIRPDFRRTKVLTNNVYSMVIVALVAFPVLGLVAGLINSFLSGWSVNILLFPLITLTAGMTTVLILMFISMLSSYLTYRHGLDPDDIVVPLLTTIGDFVGIALLLLVTGMVVA